MLQNTDLYKLKAYHLNGTKQCGSAKMTKHLLQQTQRVNEEEETSRISYSQMVRQPDDATI